MDMEVISSKAQENRFIYMSGYPALFSFTPGRYYDTGYDEG